VNPATQLIPAPPAHPPLARARRSAAGAAARTAADAAAGTAARADPEPCPLRASDLVLDETRWTVHRAGTPVDLSPTEFRLLACLMRHQGTVVSKAELLRSVWGRGYAGQPQVVETYVSYLRRKLGRLGPPLIHTRRGSGYVLRGPEARVDPRSPV